MNFIFEPRSHEFQIPWSHYSKNILKRLQFKYQAYEEMSFKSNQGYKFETRRRMCFCHWNISSRKLTGLNPFRPDIKRYWALKTKSARRTTTKHLGVLLEEEEFHIMGMSLLGLISSREEGNQYHEKGWIPWSSYEVRIAKLLEGESKVLCHAS